MREYVHFEICSGCRTLNGNLLRNMCTFFPLWKHSSENALMMDMQIKILVCLCVFSYCTVCQTLVHNV